MLHDRPVTGFQRKPISLSKQALINASYPDASSHFPLVLAPAIDRLDIIAWARENLAFLEASLLRHGAILFRDFEIDSLSIFDGFVRAVSTEMLDYREPSSPRHEVAKRIYTSTDYPADQWIHMHNEMSYAHSWPRKVFFFCRQPATIGGATPIALGEAVWNALDPALREEFERKQVMYVRNYSEGLGIPWQTVFETTDRSVVEKYCHFAGIKCEWSGDGRLRTTQIRKGVLRHPQSGQTVWFNQAHAFHLSSLLPEVREELLRDFDEYHVPRHACFGDGSPIADSVIAEIHHIYEQLSYSFPWKAGDLLMLENMLTAHGRAPYSGPRQILVAMSDSVVC